MTLSVTPYNARALSDALLNWYREHGRKSLPWHQNRTPYTVWLSEIMLQQTQVTTVIPYFEAFTGRFPDVIALADATPDEVLHLWTGLGYYARARNLHKCARTIRDQHQGRFPDTPDQLEALPGIGRSTAAAIVAQAYDVPAPILDGNVKRWLARLHCVPGWPGKSQTLKTLWQLSEHYTPDHHSQAYTQAAMDLGAMICTRRNPKCDQCPLQSWCAARATASQHEFPHSRPKKTNPVRQRQLYMLYGPERGYLLLQRPPSGIWGGLWSLPDIRETEHLLDTLPDSYASQTLEHKFSHFTLQADIYQCRLNSEQIQQLEQRVGEQSQLWYNPAQPDNIGLPAPVYKLLHQDTERAQ